MEYAKELVGDEAKLSSEAVKLFSAAQNELSNVETQIVKSGFNMFVNGSHNETALGLGLGAVVAVTAVTAGLIAARVEMEHHTLESFKYECDHNMSIYHINPSNEPSPADVLLLHFVNLILEKGIDRTSFAPYAGIVHKKDAKGETYCVVANYGKSADYDKSPTENESMDDVRLAIDNFLTAETEVPPLLKAIKKKEKAGGIHRFWIFLYGQAHFQEPRLTRFVAITLLNILEGLKYPKDAKSGELLSAIRAKELCQSFSLRLSALLNEQDKFNFLSPKRVCGKELKDMISNLQAYAHSLMVAFEKSSLHELELGCIISSENDTLQSFVNTMFSLIYDPFYAQKKTTKEKKNEFSNVTHLLAFVTELNSMLSQNNPVELIAAVKFSSIKPNLKASMMINAVPTTVMDLLILLCHFENRNKLIKELRKDKSKIAFADKLEHFVTYFILPLEGKLKATEIMPWIVLALLVNQNALTIKDKIADEDLSSFEQIVAIHELLQAPNPPKTIPYYNLSLDNLGIAKETKKILDPVVSAHFKLLKSSMLLGKFNRFLQKDRECLFSTNVLGFLVELIKAMQNDYHDLIGFTNTLSVHVNKKDSTSGLQKHILQNMVSMLPIYCKDLDFNIRNSLGLLTSAKYIGDERANITQSVKSMQNLAAEVLGKSPQSDACFSSILQSFDPSLNQASSPSTSLPPAPIPAIINLPPPTVVPTSATPNTQAPVVSIQKSQANTTDHSFILNVFCSLSITLLVAGVLAILAITYGAPYFDIINSLTQKTASTITLAGYVSAASGGIGFVSSYLVPKLFNSANANSNGIESNTSNYQV